MYKIKKITKEGIFISKEGFDTLQEAKNYLKLIKKINRKENADYAKYIIVERGERK